MRKINEKDFKEAAKTLGVEVAIIKAVCEVEAPMGGFLQTGEPVILFERHKFHQFTDGIFSEKHPTISNPRAGGYISGRREHFRLQEAEKLNREAALKSASWGKFQIMGFNYKLCGFSNIQTFINAMYNSEKAQLKAFVNFIKSVGLSDELRRKDWKGFARGYNGRAYYKNAYDKKLKRAYINQIQKSYDKKLSNQCG
ncbi:Peptidoglycan-binding protein [Tenacibaculum dicentrarchi]|uniref:Peptidoglycan-binding protein n=1 Tax=Tenacibaculum dicentrarchi TaxID=669041 RepID=A0ABM9NU54_9FLAO|nr:N-acetylmuramidase family protein [Tenacibaculum dicentrarchi]SOS54293.1 Peptidoglycan-binding protein [Tenacibaculum dicentrarchi]SOU86399.1 Peptidoglycan-binding protein [Tenacibaculum dicentrarchi]